MKLPFLTTRCQSRFVCRVQSIGIQGLYSQFTGGGGPLAKVGSSAKFHVVVFEASILSLWGVHLAKVGSSANLGVQVIQGISALLSGGGVDLLADLPRSALTIILHIKPGQI